MLIADECNLSARKSLATVNFGLRSLIWRNLPLMRTHRQQFTHVVNEINTIEYTLVHSISELCTTFRIYNNKRSCYKTITPLYYENSKCGKVECICITNTNRKYIMIYNNYIKYNDRDNYNIFERYFYFTCGNISINDMCRLLCADSIVCKN